MSWSVDFTKEAEKDISVLNKTVRKRIIQKINFEFLEKSGKIEILLY